MNELKRNLLLSSGEYINQKEYWLSIMSESYTKTTFVIDSNLQNGECSKEECIEFEMPEMLSKGVLKLCKNSDLSLYIILLTTMKTLIYRYAGNKDIMVGSPIYSKLRSDKTLNDLVVLRDEISDDSTFKELLLNVRKTTLDAYKNQDYPIYKLEELGISEEEACTGLFDMICSLKNIHKESCEDKRFVGFDFERVEGNINVRINYNANSFVKRSMVQIWGDFVNLLEHAVRDINASLSHMSILSEQEENLLKAFNDTDKEIDKSKTLNEIFEEQAEKYPDHIALVFEDQSLTYKEVNEKANQLARLLRNAGVQQETIVAIMVNQSVDMIISILGVLKAGGAYLPIDASYPTDLIDYMLSDSGTSILLTMNEISDRVTFQGEKVMLDDPATYSGDNANLEVINDLSNAAYIIYTSGTTGQPKGVIVEQGNVLTYINAFYNEFPISEDDTILVHASYSFDHFVEEVYPVMLKGGKLVIVKKSDVLELEVFADIIQKDEINIISVSPHVLNELNKLPQEKLSGVTLFLSGGDTLKKEYISNLIKFGEVYNTYGPTEATVCATYYKCDNLSNENVLIGKPIENYSIHILDKNREQVPIGIPGEIYISSEAVTRGYLHKLELTNERYFDNPFIHGRRMYKSGDMGRWLADGNIEFMGRNDNQVKIRGYRVELQQIESAILRFAKVKEAFVMDRDDKYGVKYLCAYITSEEKLDISSLREYLQEELPSYMVPSYLIELDQIPMTLNGFKVEKSELPDPHECGIADENYIAPENDAQRKLVIIWHEVLEIEEDRIGIRSNFFDLGGHSLNAMKVVSSINKEFNMSLSLSIIFDYMTIRELAQVISVNEEKEYLEIEHQETRAYYPLSTAQKRIYLSQQFDAKGTSYNIPLALMIKGELDRENFAEILQTLLERHESFRTSFEVVGDALVQKIHSDIQLNIQYVEKPNADIDSAIEALIQPFDLSLAPLVRFYLVNTGENENFFFMDMHHIISDGISMDIIIKEFCALYEGEKLEPLKIQYRDFAIWQNNLIENNTINSQQNYWIDQLAGELPNLELPIDYPKTAIQSFAGKKIFFQLEEALTSKLKNIAEAEEATMYMVMLAAYNVFLAKYTKCEDIIVGSPVMGRTHPDTYDVVGMFVNTLPIRNYPEAEKTFKAFLQEVKQNTLKSFENQDYPIDVILDQLETKKNLGKPLYDTVFILQNTNVKEMKVGNLDISAYEFENKTSKMDLIWDVNEVAECIHFSLEYCTDLYKRETVDKFIKHYIKIVDTICNDLEVKIKDIDLLDEQENKAINNEIQSLRTDATIAFEF